MCVMGSRSDRLAIDIDPLSRGKETYVLSAIQRKFGWGSQKFEARDRSKRLFFLHIPKTAGTSVVDSLASCFGERLSTNYIEGLDQQSQRDLADSDFISGHIFYDAAMRLPYIADYKLFAMFREPYARLASHLRYMDRYNQPEYSLQFAALPEELQSITMKLSEVDFKDAAQLSRFFSNLGSWGRSAFENCQTRFLACDPESTVRSPLVDLPADALLVALERLETFDMIGLTERFEETIARMAARFEWPKPQRISFSNTESSNRKLDHKDPKIRKAMAPLVAMDVCLYARAKILFEKHSLAELGFGHFSRDPWIRGRLRRPRAHDFVEKVL